MDNLAVNHITRRRDHAAKEAKASLAAMLATIDRNSDSMLTVSEWASIARTAAEGAHYAAQAEAFTVALVAIPTN